MECLRANTPFFDQDKSIDYVLVYEVPNENQPADEKNKREAILKSKRNTFLFNLEQQGLELKYLVIQFNISPFIG
jgi:hypothetical protein